MLCLASDDDAGGTKRRRGEPKRDRESLPDDRTLTAGRLID
jgi:hypothetical protein